MNWETLINGGFLLVGLLIGHFLTKSSQTKQLRAQFEYQQKIDWMKDVVEALINYANDVSIISSIIKSLPTSTEYQKKLIEQKLAVLDYDYAKARIMLSDEDENQKVVLKKLSEVGDLYDVFSEAKTQENYDKISNKLDEMLKAVSSCIKSEKSKIKKLI